MTRVGSIGGGTVAGRRVARGGAFGLRPSEAPESRAATAAEAVAAPALLGLQEQAAPAPDDHRARRRAAAVLAELKGLQLDLLAGRQDAERLARLDALAAQPGGAADPALGAALDELRLRARLEIARRRAALASHR
jgi:hypothetical protein